MIVPGCGLSGPPVSDGWPTLDQWDDYVSGGHTQAIAGPIDYGHDEANVTATRRMMHYRIGHIGALEPADVGQLLQLCRPGSAARAAVGAMIVEALEAGASPSLFGILTVEAVQALPAGPVQDRLLAALWVRAAQGLTR